MKTAVCLLALGLVVSVFAASHMPPGFSPVPSGTRSGAGGFSVEVPGKGWFANSQENSVLFVKRIDATESIHAGLRITKVPAFSNRAAFVQQMRDKLLGEAKNPRYQNVRNTLADSDHDGLWVVAGRVDFDDTGASNVGQHGALATRNAHSYAVDPRQPDKVISVWFSWRGVNFDEAKFQAEADKFFASLRTPSSK